MYVLLTSSVLSTTSKLYFEQPAARFLVCSLIFIEYTTVDLINQKKRTNVMFVRFCLNGKIYREKTKI